MKLTKNLLTREEALKLAPVYVAFVDDMTTENYTQVSEAFNKLKRNDKVVTCLDGQYVLAKVTSVNHNDLRAVDGPVVRVGTGEATWRVDGDSYAFPVK